MAYYGVVIQKLELQLLLVALPHMCRRFGGLTNTPHECNFFVLLLSLVSKLETKDFLRKTMNTFIW